MNSHSNPTPPLFARKVFEWWSKKADTEDLLGDIDEYFQYNVDEKGKLKAQIIYFKQVISLSFSYALKKRKRSASYSNYYSRNSFAMIQNYFKIAVRNFSKHKLFTSINIFGLALGMSIYLLALTIATSIFRFDEFHENKERVFQVNTDFEEDGLFASTFNAVGYQIQDQYPFVEEVVKIKEGFSPEIKHRGNLLNFNGYFADPSFFDVFSFPLISGNSSTALSEPFSVVITQKVAETLYKDENPIGKVLETDLGSFNVTGVMDDLNQTHFYFQMLTSHQTYEQLSNQPQLATDWINYRDNYVYLLLKSGTTEKELNQSLSQLGTTASSFHSEQTVSFESTRLDSIVPGKLISNSLGIGWDYTILIVFMAIGFLILLPAIFNYTNLSMARALKRAKEIGIRKVVGAEKSQIKAQFIVETVLLTFLALIGSIFILSLIKVEFLNMLMGAESLDTSLSVELVVVFALFTLVIGILSGIFPALYFSRLNPIHTIKGEIKNGAAGISGMKKGLFVFQFFVSLVFIIGVGAIAKQYTYVFNHNHGFESDNILAVPFKSMDKQVAINELGSHKDVKSITTVSNLPGVFLPTRVDVTSNESDTLTASQVFIGDDFIENLAMDLAWGESGSSRQSTQNEELVLVNEQFLRSIAVFENQKDSLTFTLADGKRCRIVGILKDFNFEPLNELINPLIFRYSLEESNYALLTISSANISKTISDLDGIWTSIDQKAKFEATFLNEEIENAYYFIVIQIKIFGFLSALAITISCLGLLGMVSYTTENRVKEIAVRKIMGATTKSLYYTLTKDFVKMIFISALIAIPFSYLFYDILVLNVLLKYGSGLGVTEIFLSVAFLFLIGFLSIYWQTSKIANANPAGNLRYE